MITLFSLELKNDDPLALALEVRSIMHGIKNICVEVGIPLIAYAKALYPTYSHYLESLQETGNLMKITFDSLEKKFAERQKAFGKMTTPLSFEEVVFFAHREKVHAQYSSRGRGRRNFRGRGDKQTQTEKSDLHCIHCNKDWHDASTCKLPWDKIEQ